ncbi:MAG TPA: MaoC family dehydratase [Stellaceae bacterium]|nr:MaoC family dehydratase [Stellaceae bacterium]
MLYFEDFAVGQRFFTGRRKVDAAEIVEFAGKYDPQPFHLDPEAAKDSLFGGLAASGWHSAAMMMRLVVDSEFRPAGGIIGGGGELQWLKPVRPGDELHAQSEIVELRESRSRPQQGLVKVRITMLNQYGEAVQTFTPTLLVNRRPG